VYFGELVVVSGGSDNMVGVWDLDNSNHSDVRARRPTRRGVIPVSDYISGRCDWYQGVGEIAVNGHLVACAPDASGPILVFSLLTGSSVYELRIPEDPLSRNSSEWMAEEMTAFTHLRLTPFFLLTKGKVHNNSKSMKLVPSTHNVVLQRRQERKQAGYVANIDDYTFSVPPQAVAQMTAYQLYQYYQTVNASRVEPQAVVPESSACIHVWNLQTGKIAYSLVPTLEMPHQHYTITDVRVTPDFSKVFASIEMRGQRQYEERLYCWDFALRDINDVSEDEFDIVQLDDVDSDLRKLGKSWVCFM
jgi:WD40 repeat protein